MTRIIQIADIHFGTEDQKALMAFGVTLQELNPDVLVVCGDLTQRGKRSEFEAARDWLDEFNLPKLVVAGNHDTPLLNLYERVVSPFERHDEYFGDLESHVETDHAILVGLNTARGWQARGNWAEGSVNLNDLKACTNLTEAAAGKTGILICHHPFLSPPTAPLKTATKRGQRASRHVAKSSVRYLLTGHVHAPSVTVVDHTKNTYVAVSAGTLSTRLRQAPPSFNLIDLSRHAESVTVFNLEKERFAAKTSITIPPDLQVADPDVVLAVQAV